jgi:parallel beta-helix repeat protein
MRMHFRLRVSSLALLIVASTILVATPSSPASGQTACSVTVSPTTDIQRTIDGRPGGSTICFAAGLYRLTRPIVPKTGDKLIASGTVTLNGSRLLSTFTRSGAYWVASGQTQQTSVGTEKCEPVTYTGCRYPEGVFFDNRSLRQETSLSAVGGGEFYFDYGADKIYIADDPTGHKVEASIAAAAIAGFGGTHDNVTVMGFIIEKFASPAQRTPSAVKPGHGWTIMNNEIRLSSRLGILANHRNVIRGNYIHHIGAAGIRGSGDGILIEGNRVSNNNIDGFNKGYTSGIRMTGTRGLVVRGNVVTANDGAGIKTDTNDINLLIENNQVSDNKYCGIVHEVGYAAIIRNNTLTNNCSGVIGKNIGYGSQLMVISSPNVEIYGNTVIGTIDVNGIGLYDAVRGTGLYGAHEIRNAYVHDNVVKMINGAQSGLQGSRSAAFTSWNNRFVRNTYHVKTLSGTHWVWDLSLTSAQWKTKGNDVGGTFTTW